MLNRFIKFCASATLIWSLFLVVALHASAAIPPVVATSTTAYAKSSSFGYVNKVIVDPYGNVYATDSSNGAIWEVPFGTSTPIRLNSFPLYASVSAGGTGYTSVPTVTFSAPPAGGVQATAIATVNAAGAVSALTITNHGLGYTATPTITITGGGGTGATGSTGISLNATHGFTVDQYGDLIVSNSTSGNLYFFPYINGQLCTTCNAAGNEPLDLSSTYNYSTLDDYYGIVADVAADNNGNLYVAMSHCNNSGQACGLSNDSIFLIPNISPATTATTVGKAANGATLFQGSLPGGKAVLNMTVDSSGHLYYVDGVNAYVVGTASAGLTPVTIGTGLKAPSGISLDPAGNLFIVDNSQKLLYEIPNESGALNPADQFTVAAMINPYYSVGFDHAGNIYQADGTDKVINKISLGSLSFAATPPGTPLTANVTYRFNGSVTPVGFAFAQGLGSSGEFTGATGTTCVAGTTYTAAQSCVVAVAFMPSSTGTRQGAVVMQAAASKAIATVYLSGVGSGGALTVDPGTQLSLTGTTAWKAPSAIALDAAGNSYVADAGANTVQVVSAAGTAIASIGSGLNAPKGVAVDGAGNVFIADTGNSRIVEVPNEGGTLNTADQTTLAFTGLTAPASVAVDPAGGVYVADTGNARVVRLPTLAPSGTPFQTMIGSGYLRPVGVATDDAGNVYVADSTANQVDAINVMSTAQTVLLPSLSAPTSLAFDASGSLYVVSGGSGTVLRIPNVGGVLTATQQLSLGSNLVTPTGVAVNGAGVVAISDAGVPGAYTLQRSAGSVNFGNVNFSLTSSPQSITLTSVGTASVTLGATAYTATGSTANYSVTSPSTTGCTNSEVLTIGATCGYTAVLAPIVTGGTLTETLTFSSNAANASPITAVLTGVATNLSLTTTVLAQVTPTGGANPVYGQAVTVSASVTTARSGVVPTGSITFFVDGIKQKAAVTLSATAPYTASLTIPSLSLNVGTHAINASYSGDVNNASSAPALALIIQVTPQASSAVATSSPIAAQAPGSSFSFSVAVTPATTGSPTGTVSLVLAGTTTVLATAPLANGAATIVYAPPAVVGQYQYQLIYGGDANFSGSTSKAVGVSIRNPGYDVSIPTASYTVTAGQSIVIPITVTWISGYSGNVGLGAVNLANAAVTSACAGLPQYATCVFSPGSLILPAVSTYSTPAPSAVMNLTLATDMSPATPYPFPSSVIWPGGLGLALLSLLTGRRRRTVSLRVRMLALTALTFSVMVAFGGCGSGTTPYPTPKGVSTLTLTFSGTPVVGTVTVTNPNIVDTLSVQLTVQ